MKIALFTTNRTTIPPESGIVAASAYLTKYLADGLVDRGHNVTLYAAKGSKTKATLIDLDQNPPHLDFAIQREEWMKNLNLATKQFYLSALYKNAHAYDIIHLQTEPVYLGMPFAALTSVPTIVTNHNAFIPEELPLIAAYPNVPIVTISENQRSHAPGLSHIGTVYDGIATDEYLDYSDKPKPNHLAFVGRLVESKGPQVAISVANASGKSLVITGKGEEQFIRTVLQPHLTASITLHTDLVKESQAWNDLVGTAKAMLLPTLWEEPFGLVTVESMAMGTPVIAYARGATPELVVDGQTGFLVNSDPEDIRGSFITKRTGVEGLKDAIDRLYSLPEPDYRRMCAQARAHVISHFDISRMVDGYVNIYEKILQK